MKLNLTMQDNWVPIWEMGAAAGLLGIPLGVTVEHFAGVALGGLAWVAPVLFVTVGLPVMGHWKGQRLARLAGGALPEGYSVRRFGREAVLCAKDFELSFPLGNPLINTDPVQLRRVIAGYAWARVRAQEEGRVFDETVCSGEPRP